MADREQQIYRAADTTLIALNSMLRVRTAIDGLTKKEEHSPHGFEYSWKELHRIQKLNKQANQLRNSNLPILLSDYKLFPEHELFPRLITRLNTALVACMTTVPVGMLFELSQLDEPYCHRIFQTLFQYNKQKIRRVYKQLYLTEMEATATTTPNKKTTEERIGKALREVAEDITRPPSILAKDNIMYMHALNHVEKHTQIVEERPMKQIDLFGLDFDLTVPLKENIGALYRDMFARNVRPAQTISDYCEFYRKRLQLRRHQPPPTPQPQPLLPNPRYSNTTSTTFYPDRRISSQVPCSSHRMIRQSMFNPGFAAAQRVRTEFEPSVPLNRNLSAVITEGNEPLGRMSKFMRKRSSAGRGDKIREMAGVIMDSVMPLGVDRDRRRMHRRNGAVGRRKSAWKKEFGIDKELQTYLLNLKTSLRRKHKKQQSKKKQHSPSQQSTTFMSTSLALTQKSSHHIIFRGDTFSNRVNRPASTMQLRFGRISREFGKSKEERSDLYVVVKDQTNLHLHTQPVDMHYTEFIRSPLMC